MGTVMSVRSLVTNEVQKKCGFVTFSRLLSFRSCFVSHADCWAQCGSSLSRVFTNVSFNKRHDKRSEKQRQLCDLHPLSGCRKSVSILHDKTHPLNFCFQHLPSGRRLKVPLAKKNVYKKSFTPTAVSVLNAEF